MTLKAKFMLWTIVLLFFSVGGAGWILGYRATQIAEAGTARRIAEAVELTVESGQAGNYEQEGAEGKIVKGTDVICFPIRYGLQNGQRLPAELYQARDGAGGKLLSLLVPEETGKSGRGLLDLIIGVTVLALVLGAVVSFFIASSVAGPLEKLVEDVRQIARGNLLHRTRPGGGGEIAALAREIDKMTSALSEAQEDRLELSAREREMEVAEEVRASLLPEGTPDIPGYDLLALQIGCPTPGGDFYDVLEYEDGRIGMLVCQVSGEGVPGALIGATARAYLTAILLETADVSEGLKRANRYLAKGVQAGMYATAMYAVLQPTTGQVQVACAGHKVPMLRYEAAQGKAHKLHPNGFAIGLDSGPVFDRALELSEVQLKAGDRLLLSNEGPLLVQNPEGKELGEAGFYRLALKRAADSSEELLGILESALDAYADEEYFPHDIAVITIRRDD